MAKKALTEAQLLAAPKAEYMNEAQQEFFRQRLLALRGQLMENLRDTTEHLQETEVASDPSDRATQEEEQAIETRARDLERNLLKKTHEALGRIVGGVYVYCDDTGAPIGSARLLSRPVSTLTLDAHD